MNAQSIPAVVIASITFYVGLYHLLIYFRRKGHREDLTFALMCLATGFYAVFCSGLYNATSVAEGAEWQRLQFIALAFLTTAFLWFAADYTGQKPGIVTYAFSVYYLFVVIVQSVDHSALTWLVDQPAIKTVTLPFLGFRIVYYEATLGPFTAVQGLVGLAASTYILWISVHSYRRGYRRETVPLFLALGCMYVAALNDTLVSQGVYQFIYAIEYGYLAMILLMAYSLSSTVVEAAMAKEALRESEARWQFALEGAGDGVWDWNAQTNQVYFSRQWKAMLGFAEHEIGDTLAEWDMRIHPDDRDHAYREIQKHLEGETPIYISEHRLQCKDGTYKWILDRGQVIECTKDGKALRIIGTHSDITERKQREAEREALIADLEAKNAELERFTYTVSHDLKSPLITIGGFVGFLERDALLGDIERVKADAAHINDALAKMQELLDELLELSRIGRVLNPPEVVSFETIACQAIEKVRGRIEACGIQLEIASDLPAVYGDQARLVEAVQNLLDNACKFTGEQSQPRIEVGIRQTESGPVFYVYDNGIGIEAQYQDQVFGLFNKLDPQSEGTGVGLALVKRIIETHGGEIWVESQGLGQGSTFCFTLPIKDQMQQEQCL
jgi:PAS domain S-box-containing protein